MESCSGGTPSDLMGAAALTTSFILGCFPSLQPMSMSFLGVTLMISGFAQVKAHGPAAYSYLPTISMALATCVAGYGIHATNPLVRALVAATALVSVLLQCVIGLKEEESQTLWWPLDAEYTQKG